ncbi:MAG: MazG family protein [Ruminococcaceae bacterium]|jgi:tetrapyrrole methylase family protein/MazG family protein|nr:MazG family protein [Oscillospiraceae bacterium]
MTIAERKEKLLREKTHNMDSAVELVRLLRSEEGCPWDREQDHHSIRTEFIEETYEAVEAIDTENSDLLREELGDVLFQILFHTEIEREAGRFSLDDVTTELVNKMIYRHPHVFADTKVAGTGEVLDNWDRLKTEEKSRLSLYDVLKAVPKQYPALLRAKKIAKKARKGGVSFGEDMEQAEALLALAKDVTETEGGERDRNIARLVWQAVKMASPDADLEKDVGDLLNEFTESFRD